MVDRRRLISIEDAQVWFPNCGFAGQRELTATGEAIVVADPICFADVYNPNDDPNADHLRANGVFVGDFGGDAEGAIRWNDPFLVVELSFQQDDARNELREDLGTVGCDSGSLVFFSALPSLPSSLTSMIEARCESKDAVKLYLPSGKYQFYYEQFEQPADKPNHRSFYRNIVAMRS